MVVGSIVSSPSLKFGVSSVFPIVSIWLFYFPNLSRNDVGQAHGQVINKSLKPPFVCIYN